MVVFAVAAGLLLSGTVVAVLVGSAPWAILSGVLTLATGCLAVVVWTANRRHRLPDAGRLGKRPTAEICLAWSKTQQLLPECDPTDVVRLVRLRQAYLEELEQRDADGFQRWLDAAPAPPEKFISGGTGSH